MRKRPLLPSVAWSENIRGDSDTAQVMGDGRKKAGPLSRDYPEARPTAPGNEAVPTKEGVPTIDYLRRIYICQTGKMDAKRPDPESPPIVLHGFESPARPRHGGGAVTPRV